MADLKAPETQREMIQQLWYAVKGANGDGIWETVKRIERRVDDLEKSSATRAELKEAIDKAEKDDAAQDQRANWGAGMVERRKGNKIAIAALITTVVINISVQVVSLLTGG